MDVAARQAFLDQEDDGWFGTVLVEPLTAMAGGIIGGATVAVVAWRVATRSERPPLLMRVRRVMKVMR